MNRLAAGGLYAGAFLGPFGGGVTVAMLPELGSTFGVPASTAALSLTAYLLPFGLSMTVSGTLGERWGLRRAVVAACWAYAAASAACALAPTWTVFLLARGAQGVANAFTTPLLLATIAAIAPRDRVGRSMGRYSSLQAAGQTSAALVGGLAAEVDWRLAFAGVALAAVLLALAGIPSAGPRRADPPGLRSAWRPAVLRLAAVAGLGWGCLIGLNFLVALRLQDDFALDPGPRGAVLTALGLVGLVTGPWIGWCVDRLGTRPSVLTGAFLGAVLVAGVGLAPALWLLTVLWGAGGAANLLIAIGVAKEAAAASADNQAGATSVVQAGRFGGGALAPISLTPVHHADPLAAFLVPAALLATAMPLLMPVHRPRP